jgi:hypothetical protein
MDRKSDRSMKPSETRGGGDRSVKYVGHKAEVVGHQESKSFVFEKDKPVQVPAAMAEGLLAQPDKFKEA